MAAVAARRWLAIPGEPDWFGDVAVKDRVAVARSILAGFPIIDDV